MVKVNLSNNKISGRKDNDTDETIGIYGGVDVNGGLTTRILYYIAECRVCLMQHAMINIHTILFNI